MTLTEYRTEFDFVNRCFMRIIPKSLCTCPWSNMYSTMQTFCHSIERILLSKTFTAVFELDYSQFSSIYLTTVIFWCPVQENFLLQKSSTDLWLTRAVLPHSKRHLQIQFFHACTQVHSNSVQLQSNSLNKRKEDEDYLINTPAKILVKIVENGMFH